MAALSAWSAPALAASHAGRSVLVVFTDAAERELAGVPGMSVGIMSATQGPYSSAQFLLDLTQGARVAASAYPTTNPPPLALVPSGAGAAIAGWRAARARAQAAPQLLAPGLLASQISGGAGYAGIAAGAPGENVEGVLAAARNGNVSALSLGAPSTLPARVTALLAQRQLVVAGLPEGAQGRAELRALAAARAPGELLIALQRVPDARGHELLWSAGRGCREAANGRSARRAPNERGLVASVDVAPTILDHLGAPVAADVRGKPIETDGRLDSASLRSLMARLRVVGGRRLTALACLLCAWALLLLAASAWPRARARRTLQAWALRTGGLGVLWAPVAVLIPAAFEPSAAVEYATITLACLALGALTDALLPWPRAPLAPAVVAIVALTVDALAGTQLLVRSLLGPDPLLGARFYGIGNELKSGLAVLVAAAVAAALYPAVRGTRAAITMAGAGVVLAAVEGSARIGAGVGGVILVSFGFAVATVMLIPGALNRRRALIVLVTPVAALAALAALDLATAHGSGHFTGSVLHARSPGDLRDLIVRRYSAAWGELHNHGMPVATAVALAYAVVGLRRRERVLAPVNGDPAWLAALCGGVAAGVVGALAEDSGPVLLVVAVFALGCVVSYLWGRPESRSQDERRTATAEPAARAAIRARA